MTSESLHWDQVYRFNYNDTLPWYYDGLDPDLKSELYRRGIHRGSFLDICTGPATQAVHLSKEGFDVTGTDISRTAIERAKGLGTNAEFLQDDITDPKVDRRFDYLFDRGCFHVLPRTRHSDYVRNTANLLSPGGLLFLKCFSANQKLDLGPERFTPDEIRTIFQGHFEVLSIRETRFQGNNSPAPKALFAVMRKKS